MTCSEYYEDDNKSIRDNNDADDNFDDDDGNDDDDNDVSLYYTHLYVHTMMMILIFNGDMCSV